MDLKFFFGRFAKQSIAQSRLHLVLDESVTVTGVSIWLSVSIAEQLNTIAVDQDRRSRDGVESNLYPAWHLVGLVGVHHVFESVECRCDRSSWGTVVAGCLKGALDTSEVALFTAIAHDDNHHEDDHQSQCN